MTDEEKNDRRLSGVFLVLLGLTVVSIIAIIGSAVYIVSDDDSFQPLTFETVNITVVDPDGSIRIPQVDGFEAPSVLASDGSVPFFMQLCNDHDEPAPGISYTDFVVDDTGQRFRFSAEGVRFDILPGCQQVRFALEMPRDMIILADDQQSVLPDDALSFHMEGSFDLDNGATAHWQSESFLVVDDDPVIPGD